MAASKACTISNITNTSSLPPRFAPPRCSYKIKFSPKPGAPEVEVDFSPPFKRISMIEGLEEVMKIKLPSLDDPKCDKKLAKILKEVGY